MSDELLSAKDKKRGVAAAVTFKGVTDAAWAAIFGTPEEIRERRRKAIEAQKKQASAPVACATAIHGDKLYTGWDPCLRTHLRGRTHRKEIMRERGLRCVFE